MVKRSDTFAGDRPVERRRGDATANRVHIFEVLAEELVEECVVLGREIGAIPPKPIAAFCGVNVAECSKLLVLRDCAGVDLLLQKGARLTEEIPRAIFFIVSDPDIEVAPDPRAGVQRGDLLP